MTASTQTFLHAFLWIVAVGVLGAGITSAADWDDGIMASIGLLMLGAAIIAAAVCVIWLLFRPVGRDEEAPF